MILSSCEGQCVLCVRSCVRSMKRERERERDDQQPCARMHDTRRTLHDEFFYSAFAGSCGAHGSTCTR